MPTTIFHLTTGSSGTSLWKRASGGIALCLGLIGSALGLLIASAVFYEAPGRLITKLLVW